METVDHVSFRVNQRQMEQPYGRGEPCTTASLAEAAWSSKGMGTGRSPLSLKIHVEDLCRALQVLPKACQCDLQAR